MTRIKYIFIILLFYNVEGYALSDPFIFHSDINGDGMTTISDFFGLLKQLFLYPGNYFIYFLMDHFQSLSTFLEITRESYNSNLAGCLSIILIFSMLYILGILFYLYEEAKKIYLDKFKVNLNASNMDYVNQFGPRLAGALGIKKIHDIIVSTLCGKKIDDDLLWSIACLIWFTLLSLFLFVLALIVTLL